MTDGPTLRLPLRLLHSPSVRALTLESRASVTPTQGGLICAKSDHILTVEGRTNRSMLRIAATGRRRASGLLMTAALAFGTYDSAVRDGQHHRLLLRPRRGTDRITTTRYAGFCVMASRWAVLLTCSGWAMVR